jgi:rRNA maturation endonuclease Nob1
VEDRPRLIEQAMHWRSLLSNKQTSTEMTETGHSDAEKKRVMHEIKSRRAALLEAERDTQAQKKVQATQREIVERELALALAEAKGNKELTEVKTMITEVAAARPAGQVCMSGRVRGGGGACVG